MRKKSICKYKDENWLSTYLLVMSRSIRSKANKRKVEFLRLENMWKHLKFEGLLYFIRYVAFY